MIQDKKDLKEYLAYERALYFGGENSSWLQAWLLRSKFYRIWQYLWTLRHAEYHKNRNTLWDKVAFVWYHRRKYVLGNRLGFEIPENCFEKGLLIYHIAPIVVNEDARIGENCHITGNFCVGNTGAGTKSPVLGYQDCRWSYDWCRERGYTVYKPEWSNCSRGTGEGAAFKGVV